MKNILKTIIAGGVAIAMFASCDMDLVPTTAIPYDENEPLFLLASDVEQFQNGVLASYRSLQGGAFVQSTEVMCDAFNATIGFGNNYGSIHRTDASFTTSDSYAENMWQSHYLAIKNYNIVLEGAKKEVGEGLEPYVEALKGITYFFRASSYLTLARHFGNAYDPATASEDLCVPLVLKYDQYAKPARATVQEVYDQIISDLLEAEYLITNYGAALESYGYVLTSPRAMVPTIDAVYALMARYYLDVQDYAKAVSYAAKVIDSENGYKLSATVRDMENEFYYDSGSEAILQLYASKAEGLTYNTLYTMVNNDNEGKFFSSYFLPSKKIINAYEHQGDLRYQTWFTNGKYPVFMNGSRHYGRTIFIKYLGNPGLQTGVVETGAHAAKPLMISEMYLIAAEASAMNGNPVRAKAYLNTLQDARKAINVPETDPTYASLRAGTMANIKKEWFRETVGEGLRLSCLKRWGDGFDGRPVQDGAENIAMTGPAYDQKSIQPGDHVLNWPVPAYEIKLNKENLVQNPGY